MNFLRIKEIVFLVLALFLIQSSTFTLRETEQALIFQMGRVKKGAIKDAGLHLKLPFIQDVKKFDKRLLIIDGAASEIPTRDRKFIYVNTTARWKIDDPEKFYKSFISTNPFRAIPKISSILEGVTKDTVANFNLAELVRNTNKILQDAKDNQAERIRERKDAGEEQDFEEKLQDIEPIKQGREKISLLISKRAGKMLSDQFGIKLVNVQLKSISYRDTVEQKVYSRMISERMKIATKIRSSGQGEQAKIEGQLDLSLKKIESEAYRKSQEIKGKADAKAIEIYAKTMQADPGFYNFIKTLETYKSTMSGKNNYIISTDHEFLKIFAKGK